MVLGTGAKSPNFPVESWTGRVSAEDRGSANQSDTDPLPDGPSFTHAGCLKLSVITGHCFQDQNDHHQYETR